MMVFLLVVCSIVILCAVVVVKACIWTPYKVSREMRRQGVAVHPYRPFLGDALDLLKSEEDARRLVLDSPHNHHILPLVQPFFSKLMAKYSGKQIVFWWGTTPRLLVVDPDLVKEILSSKFRNFQKSTFIFRILFRIFGRGLLLAEGEDWENQRHILNPAFFSEKLKGIVADMNASSLKLSNMWEARVKEEKGGSVEVDVAHDFGNTAADILARTCFGSSFQKGKALFEDQTLLIKMVLADILPNVMIPGYRYLPTLSNIRCWKVEERINDGLHMLVGSRRIAKETGQSCSFGLDLLGLILTQNEEAMQDTSARKEGARQLTSQEIVDECKTFFFAGHETTSSLLSWATMLLAIHPEWQERTRNEVEEVCGEGEIKAEQLNQLRINERSSLTSPSNARQIFYLKDLKGKIANDKNERSSLTSPSNARQIFYLKDLKGKIANDKLGMVLNETMRLYPPAPEISSRTPARGARKPKVGNIEVPFGTIINVSIATLHRDTEIWGEDAEEFNPERFAQGVWKACKHPQGFLPFSFGPRNCIGQNFAIMETKVVMASLLRTFRWCISPNYKHSPTMYLTLTPLHGMQIILSKL